MLICTFHKWWRVGGWQKWFRSQAKLHFCELWGKHFSSLSSSIFQFNKCVSITAAPTFPLTAKRYSHRVWAKKNFLQYCYSIFSKFRPRPFSLCSSVCWNLHKIHSSGNQASVCPCICVFCSLRLRSGLSCSFHRRSIFPRSSVFVGARGKSAQSNTLNESCVPLISNTGKSPPLHMIHTHTLPAAHRQVYAHTHTHTGSFIHEVVSVSCVQRCEWSRCESPLWTDCCCFFQSQLEEFQQHSSLNNLCVTLFLNVFIYFN